MPITDRAQRSGGRHREAHEISEREHRVERRLHDGREDRRKQKAVNRQDQGYPGELGKSVPVVSDDEWVSQFDAADQLGMGVGRVGLVISGRRLKPVHDQRGRAGVARESVEREAGRRSGASVLRRTWLLLADVGRGLVRGI